MTIVRFGLLLIATLVVCSCLPLRGAVVGEALLSFPAQTEYFEYDNLTSLQLLPNYSALRQQLAGKPLNELQIVLSQLGIRDEEVQEIVVGSKSNAFYGVLAGTFNGESAAKRARARGFALRLLEDDAFCMGRETCVVFLEDSLAAFGSLSQLKEIIETRQGAITRLKADRSFLELLESTDQHSPVRGVVRGNELKASMAQLLSDWTGWNKDWSSLSSNVTGMSYSVKIGSEAHVSATLACRSETAAMLLVQLLRALKTVGSASDMPFQNMQVSASANIIHIQTDALLPSPNTGLQPARKTK